VRDAVLGVLTVAVLGWVGTNLVMGANLIEAARLAGVGKFVAIGTACSYPGYLEGHLKEEGARQAFRRRSHTVVLLRGVRIRHVWPVPFVLAAVLAAYGALSLVPPLRFGWWTLLGGQGNVVFGSTEQTSGTPWEVVVPVVFVLLLLPALPLLVEAEERRFRAGAEGWTMRRRVVRGLEFGLLHLVVGIPVAAALALAVGGWWFTWVYLRAYRRTRSGTEALAESTRAHLGYDMVVIALVAVSVALSGCASGGPALLVDSPDLRSGSPLAERFTCTGDNAVPTIRWAGTPPGTKGWAVVVDDPDAPGGTFTHWIVTGLGPDTRSVGAQLPVGAVAGVTSSGKASYVGPCPPAGQEHRYRFRVHALREPLALDPATALLQARSRIEALSLDAAEVEVTYRTP